MEKKHIRHTVIIYNRFEEEKAEFLSSFFRMTGIYALLLVRDTLDRDSDLSYEEFVIVLNGGKSWGIEEYQGKGNWIFFQMGALLQNGARDAEYLLGILDSLLGLMQESSFGSGFSESIFTGLKELAIIYTYQNLLLYNYHLRLLTVKKENRAHVLKEAMDFFSGAADQAKVLEDMPHVFYFRQECKRKVNIACRLAGRMKYYGTHQLMSDNMEYLDQNEDFTCLWSLTGMIADEDSDSLFQAISFYRMQLEEEDRLGHPEDKKFQGFIYYKMGRYYEKIEESWQKAGHYYTRAYHLAPSNYRFVYKVAFAYEMVRKDRMAEKYYDIIMRQMEPYGEENYLSPSKCEYMFKTARRLMNISLRQQQYFYAKVMCLRAIDMWEGISENKFIERFYTGPEAEEIKEGMQKRLPIERTREELEDVEKIIRMYF